ncbi:MAG: hypothetical protein ISR51_00955 [Rhodospirillales bacterium]|nr:hypothetical protein [Alphaproteobacteria bacterium]MBL6947220.1 hypothetical protein [Rhodospirillales bacterium]
MMKKAIASLISAALLVPFLIPRAAPAQQYQPWNNPDSTSTPASNERLQGFVDELNKLIDAAERQRAADPSFLRDLRGLAQGFDRPQWTQVFSDDFQDGDFTRNPGWTVTSGRYWIESGWGLRSAVKAEPAPSSGTQQQKSQSGKDVAAAIFGQILQQALDPEGRATGGSQATTGGNVLTPAAIQTAVRLSNAFAIAVDFSSWTQEGAASGRLEIGPYQGYPTGGVRAGGYVVAYTQGGGLELIRVTGRGSAIIDSRPGPFHLEDKKTHRLDWTRRADGLMTVSLDGRDIMTASDRTYLQNFDGLRLVNRGGDYIVKRVTASGTQ